MTYDRNAATDKQLDLLVALYNKINGADARYPSQVPQLHKAKLSKPQASMLIDELREQIANPPAPAADLSKGVDGAPSADQVLAMLGKRVVVTTTQDFAGWLTSVVPSQIDGTPALRLTDEAGDEVKAPRITVIKRFRVENA